MFWRKKPHRLYIPTTAKWYTRPRSGLAGPSRSVWRRNTASFFVRLFKNRFALWSIGIGLIFVVILFATSSYFAIKNIEVLREDFNIDSAVIEKELNPYIGNHILFFPRHRITRTIQEKFPEFRIVDVEKVFPDTLRVDLISHDIVANLRAYYILPKTEAVTQESKIKSPLENETLARPAFDLNPHDQEKAEKKPIEQKCLLNYLGQAICDQEENLELITISMRGLTQPIEDREQVITPKHMMYIWEAVRYFHNAMAIAIKGLDYLPSAREIHFRLPQDLKIWFTIEKGYQEQIDKLKTIYGPAELSKEEISYIDLRIKEKVIYCPKSAPCAR